MALALLDQIIAQDQAHGRNRRLMTAFILKAQALFLVRCETRAREALSQALALAAPQGYIRPFVSEFIPPGTPDLGTQVIQIAQAMDLPQSYVADLKAALVPTTEQVRIHQVMESFNTREIRILKFFSQGLSNKEIAQDLNLSVNTIRWYAAKIFSKLYVNSRGRAVARALELGLIQPPG